MGKHWESCECRKCERGRIEQLQSENERLRKRCHELTDLCENRLKQRWVDNAEYRAEVERLRELLYKTTREVCEHTKEVMKPVREALEGGDDD
jgi:predicted transcriptional regulator